MRPELRLVTKPLSAKPFCKEPPSSEDFHEGETLIVYESDGSHAEFVRSSDKKRAEPFVTAAGTIDENTIRAPTPQ